MLAMELASGGQADSGGVPRPLSDDEDGDSDLEQPRFGSGGIHDDDDEDQYDEFGGGGAHDDEDEMRPPPPRSKRQRSQASLSGAAFGFGGRAHDEESDAGSRSQTSSVRRRELQERIFPVPGLRCVLCSLAHRIQPVEAFIDENATRLETSALFRFAALVFKEKVKDPLEAEGASVPEVTYEVVANHFNMHCAHPKLQRCVKVKHLAAMREKISDRLVRYEEDGTGAGELDKNSVDLWLKVAAMESRERTLLFTPPSASRRSAAAPGHTQEE